MEKVKKMILDLIDWRSKLLTRKYTVVSQDCNDCRERCKVSVQVCNWILKHFNHWWPFGEIALTVDP